MNMLKAITDYLGPVLGDTRPWLGMWDENEGDASNSYLSINFQTGQRPGVISRYRHVELWYVGPRDGSQAFLGKSDAFEKAQAIVDYIDDNPSSSCFTNVVSLSGIIGPKETEHLRQVYLIPIEITY